MYTYISITHYCFTVNVYSNEGHKAYVIPAGGSSTLGTWGYIDGFAEMMEQVDYNSEAVHSEIP